MLVASCKLTGEPRAIGCCPDCYTARSFQVRFVLRNNSNATRRMITPSWNFDESDASRTDKFQRTSNEDRALPGLFTCALVAWDFTTATRLIITLPPHLNSDDADGASIVARQTSSKRASTANFALPAEITRHLQVYD